MSDKHPIVAVTGSSGAGTTTIKNAFVEIFRRERIDAAFVDGDSFRRYSRAEMKASIDEAQESGKPLSHFGPEANLFDKLEELFREYSETGGGEIRDYIRQQDAEHPHLETATFSDWRPVPENSDLLFYEGLHGGVCAQTWTRRRMSESHNPRVAHDRRNPGQQGGVDAARYVDLLIGVVPVINLEWIQKIHRDQQEKGRSAQYTTAAILRRMCDYIHFIVPQFSLSDINFQRVPLVDTSNPFVAHDIPSASESMLVIRFREPKKFDFPVLLKRFHRSFMSRPNTLVVPGGQLRHALEVICQPVIQDLCAGGRN